MTPFVHLRVHTEYSLVDSVVRVDPLAEALERLRMPACAITDQGNVSALVKFYKASFEHGIKPIIGADLWIAESDSDREPSRLTLLCQSRVGFKRLSALLTRSAAHGPVAGRNIVLKDWLEAGTLDGLIALSGAEKGELGRALGGGRAKKGDTIDHAVGIELHHKVGDFLEKGTSLFTIHANSQASLDEARVALLEAHTWSAEPVDPLPLFYEVIH